MRLTTKQAKTLNLAAPKRARALLPVREYDSKLEREYAWHLELEKTGGRIRDYKAHPGSLKLADGVRYNPDFLVVRLDGIIEMHEVKGGYKKDSKRYDKGRIKFRTAAEVFPWFQFVWVTCVKGKWNFERYWKEVEE
jgi:hypothetical protein